MSLLLTFLLKLLGGGVVDKVLDHLARRADSETERQRIEAARQSDAEARQRDVIVAGMGSPAFWAVWSLFAAPLGLWWALAMADTIANGALPDVARLPPSLQPYADVIFENIFYSGGGVAGASLIARAIVRR